MDCAMNMEQCIKIKKCSVTIAEVVLLFGSGLRFSFLQLWSIASRVPQILLVPQVRPSCKQKSGVLGMFFYYLPH